MLRCGETQKAKERFYADVNVDNIVILKLTKTKTNSKYLIGHLDKVIRSFVLIMAKMIGYVITFKAKMKIKIKTIN